MNKESNNTSQLSQKTTVTMVCPECGYITRDNVTNCPECGCPAEKFVPMAPVSDDALDVVEYDLTSICQARQEKYREIQQRREDIEKLMNSTTYTLPIHRLYVFLFVIMVILGLFIMWYLRHFLRGSDEFLAIGIYDGILVVFLLLLCEKANKDYIKKKFNLSDEEYERIKKEIEERNKRKK